MLWKVKNNIVYAGHPFRKLQLLPDQKWYGHDKQMCTVVVPDQVQAVFVFIKTIVKERNELLPVACIFEIFHSQVSKQ